MPITQIRNLQVFANVRLNIDIHLGMAFFRLFTFPGSTSTPSSPQMKAKVYGFVLNQQWDNPASRFLSGFSHCPMSSINLSTKMIFMFEECAVISFPLFPGSSHPTRKAHACLTLWWESEGFAKCPLFRRCIIELPSRNQFKTQNIPFS